MKKRDIVFLMAIVVIASSIFFSGCVKVIRDEPEDVLFSFAEYMNEGKYEKAWAIWVDPDTLESYSLDDPSILEEMYGEKGERIKIHDLKVINKEKIEDDKYVITMSFKVIYDGKTEVGTGNYTVVKIDGEWKIAEKAHGFESVFAICLFGCVEQSAPPTTTADTAILHATVIDKTTGDPIENVIVYLGSRGASGKCYTDNEGECLIKDFVWGSYGLGIFKKGYNRYTKSSHFDKGDNYITVELEKKSEILTSLTVEGTVIEIIIAEGTMSENHYYIIRDNEGNEEYLFNEIGVNQGFEEFVNKKVSITGFKETGFIGWQREQVEGIYVESIE